ncbi:hypothetical protein K469DRAFT_721261 [Zopfia rhizophila CBS 207.26]|uniref:PRISE-like Rossmann-fold domain-containing protein n=1 Tax=Zopfia rhizophila CBS 207.26 TaxID=1314779 RepID=A0A6A6EFW4_9PEZI|nr:hypothetical protein K469DRAFT_721261 [Zopfia rhizophila CBS 207.26]
MAQSNHALVIGSSGLIGWAVVNQLLQPYPSPSAFTKVTALVNRPLKLEDAFWPEPAEGRPKLNLVSGVNLLSSDDEFSKLLEEKVADVGNITHVFYFAFKQNDDSEKEVQINIGMMRRVVRAIKSFSPTFKSIVYPGGTRGYGIYRPGGIFTPPLTESMADNLPEDYLKTVAYPHFRSLLSKESENKKWTWTELCPDTVVGFAPNGSGWSLAAHWATYLFTYRLVHGEGAEVPYPGTVAGYECLCTETNSSTLARVAIHASLHPEIFSGKIFNVADSATPGSMRDRWPQITKWFGLKGVPPLATSSPADPKPGDFIREHKGKLEEAGVKGVDIWHSAQLDSYGYWLVFDRQLSLKRLREAGFEEERKPEEGWWEAFEMFKKAGMIL